MFTVGRRGDGSICVALMRERRKESERMNVAVCICLIYHSPAVLCSGSFEAHCLSHLVRGLPAVSVYVFVNEEGGYRDHQSGLTMLTSYFTTGMAAQKYHSSLHEEHNFICMHAHTFVFVSLWEDYILLYLQLSIMPNLRLNSEP